ncbi:sulfurtransferase complex subunit TusC [Gilvimarinus polysaccharolyticus]|uniref:sulfurtransferase complex subunit TusC n=1 Tax=Gilvimarinus polysaccharolyticus TaxID=863921 RepID=UPI0006732F61|nr:sulfurtransferase complex subunit TusC [Gilvimarinus polysaccharolyticus]
MKSLLCISRHSPYGTAIAREALEAVLAAAAFEQNIALLLMDDGVWQLKDQQQPIAGIQKSLARNLNALEMFGVDTVYAHQPSAQKRGLNTAELCIESIEWLDDDQVRQLISNHDHLLSF